MKNSQRLRLFLELIEAEGVLELNSATRARFVQDLHLVARGLGNPHARLNEYVSTQEAVGLITRERIDQSWCLTLTEAGSTRLADLRGTAATEMSELEPFDRRTGDAGGGRDRRADSSSESVSAPGRHPPDSDADGGPGGRAWARAQR